MLDQSLQSSKRVADWIGERVDDLELPHDPKFHVAAICFHVGLTHHASIVALLDQKRFASSLALIRPLMESYLRGAWVHHVADQRQIDAFVRGSRDLKAHEIVAALEKIEAFDQKRLSAIKAHIWSDLCDFTHCGGKTIFAHYARNEIRPSYDETWLSKALASADSWAMLCGLATVLLAGRIDLATEFLRKSGSIAKSATV